MADHYFRQYFLRDWWRRSWRVLRTYGVTKVTHNFGYPPTNPYWNGYDSGEVLELTAHLVTPELPSVRRLQVPFHLGLSWRYDTHLRMLLSRPEVRRDRSLFKVWASPLSNGNYTRESLAWLRGMLVANKLGRK